MKIRSMLFVPGDSRRKFDRAGAGEGEALADALILDLEDSVSPDQKQAARDCTRQMLQARGRQYLFVRINAFETGLSLDDLAAVMPMRPDGIVLPKCASGSQLQRLDHYLDAFESAGGQARGATGILPIATETAESLFGLQTFKGVTPRLWGMMWGAEDLAASLGAFENRDAGGHLETFRLARNLCLAAAASAGVVPVDTVYVDIEDLDGLREETLAARRDGFTAKAVIHPKHVAIVNQALSPNPTDIAWAQRVVAAYEADPGAGVVKMEGRMVDKPHLLKARRILELAAT